MANYQQLKAAIDQVIKANGQKEITGPVLNDTLKAIVNSLGAGYQFMGVATPSTNPGTPDQNVLYIAGEAGTYTNFNSIILPNGVSVLKWNGSWSSETVVGGDGVFDISAYKATGGTLATFADLSAALDGGNNIPSALRKGGMSVKFIQGSAPSSDNKYVQARCMAQNFTTDVTQWQGVDDEPTAVSDNLVKSGGVANNMVFNNNITPNIINPNCCQYGAVISSTGVIQTGFPSQEYCVSEYIPVNGNDIIANSFQDGNWGSFNVYDSSKSFLRVIQNSAQYTYVEDDAYIKISFRWLNDVSNIRANYGDVLTDELYNPIGGYIEKPLTRIDTIFDSKCDNLFTSNLVDKSKCLSAKIIREDGTDFSDFPDAHYWATDYIPVAGRNISANSFQSGTWGSFVVYDKDKNPIAVISNSPIYEYKEYRGDYYVRISIYSPNDSIVDFRANYGDTLQPYVEYKTIVDKIIDNSSSIDELNDERYVDASAQPVVGFDNLTSWFNAVFASWPLVRDFDGGFYMKEILYKTTGATLELHNLSIVNGVLTDNGIAETIALDSSWLDPSLGQNVYRIPFEKTIQYIPAPNGFFADNETLDDIGYISAGTTIANLPEDDKKHAIAFGIIARGFTTEYDKLSEEITELKTNILKDKKIGFLGDSITALGQYVTAFQQMSNCIAVNYGIGGSHIAARNANDTEAFEKRVPSLANDLDAVVVFGGTNDFGHNNTYGGGTAQFGTFDDYTDADIYSFYAGCHRTFKQLYDKYRGKPIIVMTPLHHGYEVDNPEITFNADGTITQDVNSVTNKTFKQYVDAIKEVASYYSFVIIDAYSESGLNPCLETSNARYYFTDGLHLNQVGGNRLANFMLPLMEQVFSMFKNIS